MKQSAIVVARLAGILPSMGLLSCSNASPTGTEVHAGVHQRIPDSTCLDDWAFRSFRVNADTGLYTGLPLVDVEDDEPWKSPCNQARSEYGRIYVYGTQYVDDLTPTRNAMGEIANPSNAFMRRVNGVSLRWNLTDFPETPVSGLADSQVPASEALAFANVLDRDCAEFLIGNCVQLEAPPKWNYAPTHTLCKNQLRAASQLAYVPMEHDATASQYQCTAAGFVEAARLGWSQRRLSVSFSAPLTGTPHAGAEHVPPAGEVDTGGCMAPASFSGALAEWADQEGVYLERLPGWENVASYYDGTSASEEARWTRAWSYLPSGCPISPFESTTRDRFAVLAELFSQNATGAVPRTLDEALGVMYLNGEEGYLGYFEAWGLMERAATPYAGTVTPAMTSDQLAEQYERIGLAAVAEGLDPSNLAVNVQGGGIYIPLVEMAADNGFGIAAHGPGFPMDFKSLQFFDDVVGPLGSRGHLRYNATTKGMELTRHPVFPTLHTDLEVLHATRNTAGQYKMFKISALSALAHGFNSLTVTGSTIPTAGVHQQGFCDPGAPECENYDHSQIEPQGAEAMLEWMHRTIGKNLDRKVEAWCWLGELGTSDGDFYTRYAEMQSADPTLRIDGSYGDVRSPLRTHIGSGCSLDPNFAGMASLRLSPDYLGTEVGERLVQFGTDATFADWLYTGVVPDCPSGACFGAGVDDDEGREGDPVRIAATDEVTHWPAEARRGRRLDLLIDTDSDAFRAADALVVAVTFTEVPGSKWRVDLRRGASGSPYASSGNLEVPSILPAPKTRTAYFSFPSGRFKNRIGGYTVDRVSLAAVGESSHIHFVRVIPVDLP